MCLPRRTLWENSLISSSTSSVAGPATELVSTSSPVCRLERRTAKTPWPRPPVMAKRRLSPVKRGVDILKRT